MQQRVGTCSLCGGDVMGHRGGWMAITPPPPDRCAQCGAVRAEEVIEMRKPWPQRQAPVVTNAVAGYCHTCGTSHSLSVPCLGRVTWHTETQTFPAGSGAALRYDAAARRIIGD